MTPMPLQPEAVEAIVLAACSLHNFLRDGKESCSAYTPTGMLDSEDHITHAVTPRQWRQSGANGMLSLDRQSGNRCRHQAQIVRDEFCRYFNSEIGAVPWQWNVINH